MRDTHTTNDEMLDALYMGEEPGAHTRACPECAKRWEALVARRSVLLQKREEVAPGRLALQRHKVTERLEAPQWRRFWLAAPALTAMAAALVITTHVPRTQAPIAQTQAPVEQAQVSDEQLFADISTAIDTAEPRAAAPLRALFEEGRK